MISNVVSESSKYKKQSTHTLVEPRLFARQHRPDFQFLREAGLQLVVSSVGFLAPEREKVLVSGTHILMVFRAVHRPKQAHESWDPRWVGIEDEHLDPDVSELLVIEDGSGRTGSLVVSGIAMVDGRQSGPWPLREPSCIAFRLLRKFAN